MTDLATGTTWWTEERIDSLDILWRVGWSARQIGEELGCTRNAVIGKANRMGLSKPTKSSITRERKAKEREEEGPLPAASNGHGVRLLRLRPRSCRWPLWQGLSDGTASGFRHCGRKTKDGPYCSEHAPLAVDTSKTQASNKKRVLTSIGGHGVFANDGRERVA